MPAYQCVSTVSVATMTLVEQGRLKINESIFTWLPELKDLKLETVAGDVPLARAITVQDLLMHPWLRLRPGQPVGAHQEAVR